MDTKRAYEPPHESASSDDVSSGVIRDPVRTAGVILLVHSSLVVMTWAAQAFWNWTPRWTTVVETTVLAALGAGLLRFGRKLLVPTLAVLVVAAARPVVRVLPMFEQGGFAVLAGPVLLGAMRILPTALLLLGRPGRVRYTVALVVFAVGQLLGFALFILQVYVKQQTNQP